MENKAIPEHQTTKQRYIPAWLSGVLISNAWLRKAFSIGFWILIWQLTAVVVNNDILLSSPIQTVQALLENALKTGFWTAIGFSMLRILLGFSAAFLLAIITGALAWRWPILAELLNPMVTFIKSVPVVCFIVMLLIWFGARWVSLSAVLLVAYPAFYFAVLEGLGQRDEKLNEMLRVFRVTGRRKMLSYHWPAILPFIQAASKTAVGMSWKSGVAAELIGLPMGSIGEAIYRSKILLNSADVFAWTLVVVGLSIMAEKAFLLLLQRSDDLTWQLAMPRRQANQPAMSAVSAISVNNLYKSYGDKTVLHGLSIQLDPGGRYLLSSPSGTGKTTLLHLLAGLELADSGVINNPNRVAMVFQEARLFERRSALENISLVCGSMVNAAEIQNALLELLPADALNLPVQQLSGGMRRRVEICRAVLTPSQILLLDEPFTGLDSESANLTYGLINRLLNKRILVFASHDLLDGKMLAAETVTLDQ
ncbi:MAG: ATP-binding cassette domain-containing protein [Coriobacteriales bacterium]|jgi:NitT/TauT family transport system permease protein|nr:ATP-binding cassette domain-containing protein [Coriobacteriales bacterium]